jgi:hypothetical protein
LRTGKTAKQIEELKEQLDLGKTVLVAGLKSPEDYLNRLREGYEAIAVFSSFAENVKIGYKFKKI